MTETLDAVKRPSGGVGRMLNQIASQPYLSIVLVGSLLLSVASFYTTFTGMMSFRDEILVVFCIVVAVQGLLFVTSWRIGFAVAERERLPIFTSLVFLICLATSVLFSWEALFNHINDDAAKERTRTARLHRVLESNADDLAARVTAKRDAEVAAMAGSSAFKAWETELGRVAAAALAASDAVDAARKVEAEEIAGHIAVLEAERADLLRGAAGSAERTASNTRELEAMVARRDELTTRAAKLKREYDALREQVIIKEGEMRAEEKSGRGGRGAGRGPVWESINAAKIELELQRDTKKRLYDEIQIELKGDVGGRKGLDDKIEALRAELAAPGGVKSPKLVLLERQINDLRKRLESSGGGGAFASEAAKMRAALTAFKGRHDLAQLAAASGACRRLLDGLKADKKRASIVARLSCDDSALAAPRKGIEGIEADAAALAIGCAPGGAKAPVIAELKFKEAAAHGAKCFSLSGLKTDATQDLRDKVDRLIQEGDPNTSGHLYAINGLLYGDKMAYLTLGMALFIDLLVLFSGLIGAASASSKLQLALGGVLTKSEIEDFERALRPDTARFILDRQRALHSGQAESEGATRRRSKKIHFSAQIDLAGAAGEQRVRDGARAFLIAQMGKGLVRATASVAAPAMRGSAAATTTLATTDAFRLSDELMRGLRAYLETPDSYRLDGLPLAGALSEGQRRAAARALRRAAHPYRAGWSQFADWSYTAVVDLAKVTPTGDGDAIEISEHARQVMLGLYAEGLAKPANFAVAKRLPDSAYLMKDGALELLDRAARLGAEEAAALRQIEEQRLRALEAQAKPAMLPPPPETKPASAPSPASPPAEQASTITTADDGAMTLTPNTATPTRIEPVAAAKRTRKAKAEEAAETAPEAAKPATDDAMKTYLDTVGLGKRGARVLRDKAS